MKKDYKAGTYTVKTAKKKKTGTICKICATCNNKSICKNRKNTTLMRKCPECRDCKDAENCDTFYITTEHKVLIPIGRDETTGDIIRKSFSSKTESEAIYKAVQYKKDIENGNIKPVIRKSIHSVVSLIQEYEDKKFKNGIDEKMQKIKLDIDEAIKSAKKYINFKNILKEKGYIIYDSGKYFTVKSPYFNRKVRLNRVFGDDYSLDGIKHRIYYKSKELAPVLNFKKKYYKKVYIGPEINPILLKISSFYRLYVHYLYKLGKLPPKVVYKGLTPEYFKQKRENNRIFEELNFINRKNFQSIQEVRDYKENCEKSLPKLKSKRENLWRKYNKTDNETDNETEKEEIKQDIVKLSEKIETINNHSKICSRYIDRLKRLKEEYRQKEEEKSKMQEMDKKEKLKSRYR